MGQGERSARWNYLNSSDAPAGLRAGGAAGAAELQGAGALGAHRRAAPRPLPSAEDGMRHLLLTVDVERLYRRGPRLRLGCHVNLRTAAACPLALNVRWVRSPVRQVPGGQAPCRRICTLLGRPCRVSLHARHPLLRPVMPTQRGGLLGGGGRRDTLP